MSSFHLALSFQLVSLMDWLSKYGKEDLRKLIRKSINDDLILDAKSKTDDDFFEMDEKLYESVSDFITFMEDLLIEELKDEMSSERVMGAVREMKIGVMEQEKDVKQELLQKMFRDWKPNKNEPVN